MDDELAVLRDALRIMPSRISGKVAEAVSDARKRKNTDSLEVVLRDAGKAILSTDHDAAELFFALAELLGLAREQKKRPS